MYVLFHIKWVDFLHFDKILGKNYFLLSNLSIAASLNTHKSTVKRLKIYFWFFHTHLK